jgi:AAA family ATP:ADP antiporter
MEFSKWRQRLWPIHRFELKKLLPLFFIKFFISLNYGILNTLKDTVVVTAKNSGAEVIPVLKGWFVLPMAIIAAALYAKLNNRFKRTTLFYGIIGSFLVFYIIYAYLLCPYSDYLCPNQSSDWLISVIGQKYQHWVAVYRYWMHSIFFVSAELWGSLIILLLFWGFSNDISPIEEAKRFYTLFSAGGNVGAIVTAPIVWYVTKKYAHLDYYLSQQHLILLVVIFGVMALGLFWYVNRFVLSDKRYYRPNPVQQKEGKTSLNLLEGLKILTKYKIVRYLAILVISYGLVMNLIEVSWKATLKLHYPNPNDYQSFMAGISMGVGIVSFFVSVFIGSNVMRKFGWRASALVPPFAVSLTGLVFLFLVMQKSSLSFGASALAIIVFYGAFQNILCKAVKYTFFDTTKEMAFIPLNQEYKVKGKAAIDVVGSRLGKSGSAWIQIILIEIAGTGSVLSITPYLIPLIIVTMLLWARSVHQIDKELFQEKPIEAEVK